MEDITNQFDSTLGGAQHLPESIKGFPFVTARGIEISAMTENIQRPSSTKLIFQTLPVHMRRRVMSHNCKRLPRKLRDGHMSQMKKNGMPPKQKRPSRKYRRRPNNIFLEYHCRKRRCTWLETHIWSARRFHMTERWGYRLPEASCDKSFRACYRAVAAHSLLQDISYFSCIQIEGELEHIKEGFQKITRSACGLGVCAKTYLTGSREGSAEIFEPNKYPCGYIGKIDYIWKNHTSSEFRIICIFVHPAFYSDILKCLLKIFSLTNISTKVLNQEVPAKKMKMEVPEIQSDTLVEYSNILGLKLTELQGTFNRFRLTGPKSQPIVVKALRAVEYHIDDKLRNSWIGKWLHHKDANDINLSFKYWNDLSNVCSPAQLPSRMVLALNVKDPRLCKPLKRIKAEINKNVKTESSLLLNIPHNVNRSPLWYPYLRAAVVENKLSTSDLIKYATEHQLVPGETDIEDLDVQPVPIIMIQRPGNQSSSGKCLGFASGWDIIIPQGYAMSFWLSLILCGARAGGLRETERLYFEAGQCYLSPDSEAGKAEEDRICKKMRARYFGLPPTKRVNYLKNSINSPFLCRWDLLIRDWAQNNINKEEVLREKGLLAKLQSALKSGKLELEMPTRKDAIVPITVTLEGKGNLINFAIICRPKQYDLSEEAPVEPAKRDKNAGKRKELSKSHRTHKRKEIKLTKERNKTASNTSKKVRSPADDEYINLMQDLWLPREIKNVRWQCSHEVMGRVSHGGYSYSRARGFGVGYVAYNSLIELILGYSVENNYNRVLVRNTTSRQYRFAVIDVIL